MPNQTAKPLIRTKIVATLGPATADPDRLAAVLESGVDVCRLNFSHGVYEEHQRTLAAIRAWAAEHDRPIAVLGDLCGPKIRLNKVARGEIDLKRGDVVRFVRGDADCTREAFTIGYAGFIDEVADGQRVFIDDGLVRLLVTARDGDSVTCTCTTGGVVSSHKGVNLPDTELSAPALTDKDKRDLDWVIEHSLDYVALSFVRRPQDLTDLLDRINDRGADLGVIVKIEKPEALEHLDDFIERADGVMAARGDLGVEMDVWRVPLIQKDITARCRAAGKPVIIATQMLQSMVNSPVPTRAEVSDVANAILDRADAVMLSAETSVGQYPVEAVCQMRRIAVHTESFGMRFNELLGVNQVTNTPVVSAVVHGANVTARDLKPPLVAVWTRQGKTAVLLSKHRLDVPIIALTPSEQVCRQLTLVYGVVPVHMRHADEFLDMLGDLDRLLLDKGLAARDDQIVVVADTRPDVPGETDALFVHVVGSTEKQ